MTITKSDLLACGAVEGCEALVRFESWFPHGFSCDDWTPAHSAMGMAAFGMGFVLLERAGLVPVLDFPYQSCRNRLAVLYRTAFLRTR